MDRNAQCTAIENSCKLLNVTRCLVSCEHRILAVVSVYRSPSISSVDSLLEIRNMFSQLLCLTAHVIIVGDFTFDLFTTSSVIWEYLNILQDFQFTQNVPNSSTLLPP